MLKQISARCAVNVFSTALVFVLLLSDRCAGGVRTWDAGGDGVSWEQNCNWSGPEDQGTCFGFQPFDGDDVIIPFGTPVISFLEGINTLDVDASAGISNNGVLSVHNGVVNDGLITFGPNAGIIIGAGALVGSGEVVLADSTGTNASLQGAPHTACCVTHGADHTIRGEGIVTGKWVNDGLIRAEETSGDETALLTISGTMTNNGVIRSSATGTILLESVALTMGATGQFIADTQSIVLSGATTIIGGSIDAINGAKFVRRPDAGGTTVFSGVTINGDFDVLVNNAGVSGIGAGITNNGTMTIDNMGVANGQLHMDTGSTLDGTGQVILNRSNNSTHLSGNFTHGASHTIRGAGRIQATIVNNGSIIAEPKNDGALLRVLSGPITNNNLMQANDGATMRFEFQVAVTQGSAGRIRAADGGRVELRDQATIIGGKLQTEGTGVIVDTSSSFLNNVTNEGEFHVQAGSTTRVNTSLINNGTITVNPSGVASLTTLEFSSDTVLSGTGTIVLNQTLNGARIASAQSSQDITQEAGHTIRGAGWIANGYFGDGKFINHGHLEGNSAAEPLDISARLSGSGTLKNVRIGGFGASHTLGDAGTTAIVAVEGLYNIVNSSMLVDLAGTTPGTGYDQLNSTGPIMLSSAPRLEVSLANGFKPTPGDSFTLLTTTDTLTGNFGTVVLPTLPLGLSWTQQQTANSFSISLTGSLAADFDLDGDVDGDDLAIWQAGYATGTLHGEGNADGDGDIDGRDFLIWQRSFGWGVETPVASSSVPEPGSACLLLSAVFASFGICRRKF